MKVNIKIFGERNTGTNYLKELIRTNLDVNILKGSISKGSVFTFREWTKDLFFSITKSSNLGWKHASIDSNLLNNISNKVFVISLTKNPYSFLLSLYKRPYHYKGKKSHSFIDFISHKWELRKRDNIKGYKVLENPVDLWNIKNRSYINFASNNKNIIHVKYEDLLKDPKNIIKRISRSINVPLKDQFTNYEVSTKKDNKIFVDYQDYYLHEKWKAKITNEEIKFINSKLDKEVVNYFGYILY